jgi:hypothetical protein
MSKPETPKQKLKRGQALRTALVLDTGEKYFKQSARERVRADIEAVWAETARIIERKKTGGN